MQIKKLTPSRKIIVMIGLIVALALAEVERAEEAQDSPNSLKDFVFLPGSAVLVDQGYILALFENWRNGLYAVVVFAADCNQAGCTIGDLISCSIFDPEGANAEDTDDFLRIKGRKILQTQRFDEGAFLTLA